MTHRPNVATIRAIGGLTPPERVTAAKGAAERQTNNDLSRIIATVSHAARRYPDDYRGAFWLRGEFGGL